MNAVTNCSICGIELKEGLTPFIRIFLSLLGKSTEIIICTNKCCRKSLIKVISSNDFECDICKKHSKKLHSMIPYWNLYRYDNFIVIHILCSYGCKVINATINGRKLNVNKCLFCLRSKKVKICDACKEPVCEKKKCNYKHKDYC